MSSALRRPMSLAEFLDWEQRQPLRYEFDGERPVAMTGETLRHNTINLNILLALRTRLGSGRCRAFGPTVKVLVQDRVRYPDIVVTCSPQADQSTVVEAPVVVFEILSPATSRTDRIAKAREYFATPSIRRYVILEQEAMAATMLVRGPDAWAATPLTGEAALDLPEIGVSLPLAACYEGIEIADEELAEE